MPSAPKAHARAGGEAKNESAVKPLPMMVILDTHPTSVPLGKAGLRNLRPTETVRTFSNATHPVGATSPTPSLSTLICSRYMNR